MSRRFVVVTCVRNTASKLTRCLESIAEQDYPNFHVVIVDDASTDSSGYVADWWGSEQGWTVLHREERHGAVVNQVDAIRLGCDDPDDVIVFVDGDDRLERTDTFDILNRYYDDGALLTYGSYRPDPPDAGCAPARPYPSKVIRRNAYRASPTRHSYNHLRTFTYGLFSQLDDADFRDDRGEWFTSTPDAVMMFPCLELARGRIAFVPEVLLVYSSDLPSAEWRNDPTAVDYVNRTILNRPPKSALAVTDTPAYLPRVSGCECRACAALTYPALMRLGVQTMHLCPDCGNKRCPKANYHGYACTGSNDTGQPGSAYP